MDFDPPTTAFTGKYSLPHLDGPFVDSFSGSVVELIIAIHVAITKMLSRSIGTPGFDSFTHQTCNINRLDMFGTHGVAPFHVFAVSDVRLFDSLHQDCFLICPVGFPLRLQGSPGHSGAHSWRSTASYAAGEHSHNRRLHPCRPQRLVSLSGDCAAFEYSQQRDIHRRSVFALARTAYLLFGRARACCGREV